MGYFKGNNYDFTVTPPHEKGCDYFFINLPYWLHRWMMFSTYCFTVGEPRKGNCKK
ncbi:hypothetical protein IKG_05642 [Bacillus cereus VD200]|nr:hypothetical protein IKG_05642 [Bacillus cereus VD200]